MVYLKKPNHYVILIEQESIFYIIAQSLRPKPYPEKCRSIHPNGHLVQQEVTTHVYIVLKSTFYAGILSRALADHILIEKGLDDDDNADDDDDRVRRKIASLQSFRRYLESCSC